MITVQDELENLPFTLTAEDLQGIYGVGYKKALRLIRELGGKKVGGEYRIGRVKVINHLYGSEKHESNRRADTRS